MKKITLSFIGILCMPLLSVAHPGHGYSDGHTIIHYFMEPIHAVATFSLIFIVAFAFYAITRNRKQDIKSK